MKINQYLESTYLKTSTQAHCTDSQTEKIVIDLVQEAIDNRFRLVMIRPSFVELARKIINHAKSDVLVGTVIGFHEGESTTAQKIKEAKIAIENGADDLDVVINYRAFLKGNLDIVKEEILTCTTMVLKCQKTIKWIIEIAALTNAQIKTICNLIRDVVLDNFHKEYAAKVFVKSSTGFFQTSNDKPNGATPEGIALMLKNASPLPVKAAGGVKTCNDALKMINLGVSRIGTSSAKAIIDQQKINSEY